MRILFLGPANACHVTRWVGFLQRAGHDVLLASLHEIPPQQRGRAEPLVPVPGKGATSLLAFVRALPVVRRLARRHAPDLCVAYYMTSYGLLAAVAGCRPWIGAAAGGDVLVDAFDPWPRRLRNRLALRIALPRAAGMLAWADHVARRLVELGYPRERILVQPRGVDRALFRHRPPRRRMPNDPLRVLSIRWLKPLYRVDTLVEALAELRRRGVPFEARIGGTGPERPRLEALARRLGLAGPLRFLGEIPADEVPSQLAWSDVYVSTSSSDGASASLFEALAVGSYPVVTDIEANRPYVVPGRTGALFPVGDAKALADRLEAVARDDDARRAAIAAARSLVETRLDWEANMRRIEGFLERTSGRA
ncbi:MAG: glycosyltransferase [Acidobacteria bacterium]|nr:MAG: glycosyltransferase [Acidobacteriota bacterium]